ncbi:phosphotransferase enzyme family protein [Beauveria bassiana ARSEF 2860]|uniref:Phosphotransferase enzyme family protein n=1 Tax=Beauveria bassiana (strain ARSEF 2860) TaxID=655819 RepID=J4WF64_BEAB2|nr:phosphotransferase enzyme family protein [Beauveria bassiana ARSEF 2860]EJP68605.1 phosphotransferase enzyme family protein [Beauveria bassiana ARSEF 2860]
MPSPIPPPSIPQVASLLHYDILFSEPDDSLPEPLPTTIEAIEDAPTIHKLQSRCIARVGTSYAVKYGYAVEPLEAENMKFVRQNTNIYVPRVYAVYQRFLENGKHQKTYIVMERIAGESLDKLWDGFDTTEKLAISQQLKETFISLRDLPHDGFFGSLDKTKLRDFLFCRRRTHASHRLAIQHRRGPHRRRTRQTGFWQKILTDYGTRPHITDKSFQKYSRPDGRIAIVDWAASGWYPVYWEYAVAVCAHRGWSSDWHTYIRLFLDEYPNHFAWMSRLRME